MDSAGGVSDIAGGAMHDTYGGNEQPRLLGVRQQPGPRIPAGLSKPMLSIYLFIYLPKYEADNIQSKFHSATGRTDRRMSAPETHNVLTHCPAFCVFFQA